MKPFSILPLPLPPKNKTPAQENMIAKIGTRASGPTVAIGIATEMDHGIVTETGSVVSGVVSADETKMETKR